MKVFLKRRLNVFPKLRRRLSSVKWILLVATTAMFFLSTFSSACDGLTLTFGPIGPSVLGGGNPQATQPALTTMPSVSPLTTGGGTPGPGSVALGGGTPPSLGGTPPAGGPGNSSGGAVHMVTIALGSKTATDPSGFIFVDAVTKTNVTNVKKGDTVVWTNPTKADHTVTADPGQAATFDSGDFAPNGKPFSTFIIFVEIDSIHVPQEL